MAIPAKSSIASLPNGTILIAYYDRIDRTLKLASVAGPNPGIGAVNVTLIDNAGGVNCSDHEVNIKILLDDIVKRGDMTDKQRNQLLASMTDEVSELVIRDNYRQTQALSLSEILSQEGLGPYRRFINELEAAGQLKVFLV